MENLRISTKRVPKVSQREPKGARREPKGAKSEPKGSQRAPKGSHLEAKGCQKWAKGRPKCIEKSTFGEGREKYAKRVFAGDRFWFILGVIFHQKSMNKSMRKSMPKKGGKSKKKRGENGPAFWWFSELLLMKNSVFRKRCMCENHSIYRVERVSARVRGKKRKVKQKEIYKEICQK